jgi:hypothetical protein
MTPDAPRTEAPDPLRAALLRLRETVAGEVMHWSEDFHPGELPTPETALVSRLNVFDDIDKELAALSSATPAPLDVERLAEAYRIVESTPVTLTSSEDNELADAEWMARALAAEYARLTEAGS